MNKERYENLFSITNRAAFFSASLHNLKLKFQSECVFAYQGHFFTSSMELLAYLKMYEEQKMVVVLDDHDIPILVPTSPLEEFFTLAETTYHEASLGYLNDHAKLVEQTEELFNEDS